MRHRGLDVRLRVLGRRTRRLAWGLAKQHYVTLGSAVVISVLFMLVMTSDSFVSREDRAGRQPPATSNDATALWPTVQRHSVLFYVVQDQKQLMTISEAFADDLEARAAGPFPVDRVVYLIAGTDEEEAATIARLNFEALLVQGANVDMKVVDMRGRFAR